jgi:hypothetical protein
MRDGETIPFFMPQALTFFEFTNLNQAGAPHAISARHGGVSPAPWASLNLGQGVGDAPERVSMNLAHILKARAWQRRLPVALAQVHGCQIQSASEVRDLETPAQGDGLISQDASEILMMRFADCVPVLLFDPERQVAGLAHAGWKGTVLKVAAETVKVMHVRFGCRPKNILAGIGPSICADHYEVGEDVRSAAVTAFGEDTDLLQPSRPGKVKFDLRQANQRVLHEAGVQNIEIAGQCTVCQNEDWFSHRAKAGETGRFAAFIGVPQ